MQAGFIKHPPHEIVQKKIEAILICVICQGKSEIEDLRPRIDTATEAEKAQVKRTQTNLEYLTEMVIPEVLQLSFLDGVELTVESSTKLYLELTRELTRLENLSVPSYNSERCVDSIVKWCNVERKYVMDANLLRQWRKARD